MPVNFEKSELEFSFCNIIDTSSSASSHNIISTKVERKQILFSCLFIMLVYITRASLRTFTHIVPQVTPVAAKGFATRFLSTTHYAVDAPDGEHDLEDVEEHMEGVKRIIDFASISEDVNSIKMEHDVVMAGKPIFAVDAPDGEHDFEDLVSST